MILIITAIAFIVLSLIIVVVIRSMSSAKIHNALASFHDGRYSKPNTLRRVLLLFENSNRPLPTDVYLDIQPTGIVLSLLVGGNVYLIPFEQLIFPEEIKGEINYLEVNSVPHVKIGAEADLIQKMKMVSNQGMDLTVAVAKQF